MAEPSINTERREFFWSARTLRCDVWRRDPELGEYIDRTEDVLIVDQQRCVVALAPYHELIPRLLTAHFQAVPDAG